MRNVFIFFAFLIAGMAHAQIITNVDKLRIRDVEQGVENDKILVIDSDNVVRWIDAIEVDLSDYYTISEVDAFVADLEAGLLERYTKDEVDALLDGLELRLDDYYTKTEADSIITNVNDRIDDIDLNTVTSVDNVTSIKIRGSDIFTNNLESDFAQIADVNKAGFGLISMQSEMKIGLVAKDGTTLLDDVDVSWLASGDLAITIDDTDPNNPELVFSQGGVEVARIPASTLLSGVARSANLSNYILQFKDGTGAVVYSVNLEPLFEDYFTKAEANDRFALRTRTITGTGGLTGGGNLTANRTIDLSSTTKSDIAKGVTAHSWGDFRTFGLGNNYKVIDLVDSDVPNGFYGGISSETVAGSPSFMRYSFGIIRSYEGGDRFTDLSLSSFSKTLGFRPSSDSIWREIWHTGNLSNPATESWVNDQGFVKSNALNNYYTKNESNNIFEPIFSKNSAFNKNFGTGSNDVSRGNHTHSFASLTGKPTTIGGYGITDAVPNSRTISAGNGLTGGGNLTANRTIALSTDTQNDIAKGVTAHGQLNTRLKNTTDTFNGVLTIRRDIEGWPDSTDNSSTNYINNAIAKITAGNNSMSFFGDGTENRRRFGIQIGHTNSSFASALGILELNPFGGAVKVNGGDVWHTGNLEDPATEGWVNSQGFIKSLSNYYTKSESNDTFATKTELNTKENAFSKNTAFNKNFGTGSNDVSRGNHTHTFASLTSKPTTISGYGITDFNSLGDARWALRSRTISAGTGLTGGGNLTANRTIALSTDTQEDISQGVSAFDNSLKYVRDLEDGEDLNEIKDRGIYQSPYGLSLVNAPIGEGGNNPVTLIVYTNNISRFPTQVLYGVRTGKSYFRGFYGSGYSEWKEHWNSKNLTDPASKDWVLQNVVAGDIEIDVDKSDPSNPILIFKQGGQIVNTVEIGSLLGGVAVDANRNGYELDFVGGDNTSVYSLDLEPIFEGNYLGYGGYIEEGSNLNDKFDNKIYSIYTGSIFESLANAPSAEFGKTGVLFSLSAKTGQDSGAQFFIGRNEGVQVRTKFLNSDVREWRTLWDSETLPKSKIDKLDAIESGAQKNVATNLGNSATATSVSVTSSTGSNTSISGATASNAGVMTASDKAKLNGIESQATKNRADSQNANKVHSHTIAEITGLQTELDDKVDKVADKGLSSNDFTNTLKSKLDGIAAGATKNRPDSQNAGKTENNTFSGNNTFTNPVKVPMGVNPDEAINLAQLTASNPIALNKVIPAGQYVIPKQPVGSEWNAVTLVDFNDPDKPSNQPNAIYVPLDMLSAVGGVVRVTLSFHSRPTRGNPSNASMTFSSSNFGIGEGNNRVGGYNDYDTRRATNSFEIIIRRNSNSTVTIDSKVNSNFIETTSVSQFRRRLYDYGAMRTGFSFNITSYNNIGYIPLKFFVTMDVESSTNLEYSNILIEKIK